MKKFLPPVRELYSGSAIDGFGTMTAYNPSYYKADFYNSLLTSNYMMLVMFILWLLFFWLGESLALVLFDYSSTLPTVYSPSFYRLKYHTFYSSHFFSNRLTTLITTSISFLAYLSISYLIQILKYNNYFYFENRQHIPFFLLLLLLFTFS